MSRIFLINYSGHDLHNINDFGKEILYMTEGTVNIFDMKLLKCDLEKFLKENKYDSKKDYIAFSGNVVINFLVGEILGEQKIKYQVLIYNQRERKYVEPKWQEE